MSPLYSYFVKSTYCPVDLLSSMEKVANNLSRRGYVEHGLCDIRAGIIRRSVKFFGLSNCQCANLNLLSEELFMAFEIKILCVPLQIRSIVVTLIYLSSM